MCYPYSYTYNVLEFGAKNVRVTKQTIGQSVETAEPYPHSNQPTKFQEIFTGDVLI